MDVPRIVSYVVAGFLGACGVTMVTVLACIAIRPRQVSQNEMRVMRENDRRVERADTAFQEDLDRALYMAEAEFAASPIDVTAGVLAWLRPANCVPSVNPDGSVAVARELVVENKSVV